MASRTNQVKRGEMPLGYLAPGGDYEVFIPDGPEQRCNNRVVRRIRAMHERRAKKREARALKIAAARAAADKKQSAK